jgi:hypothetical protein
MHLLHKMEIVVSVVDFSENNMDVAVPRVVLESPVIRKVRIMMQIY